MPDVEFKPVTTGWKAKTLSTRPQWSAFLKLISVNGEHFPHQKKCVYINS